MTLISNKCLSKVSIKTNIKATSSFSESKLWHNGKHYCYPNVWWAFRRMSEVMWMSSLKVKINIILYTWNLRKPLSLTLVSLMPGSAGRWTRWWVKVWPGRAGVHTVLWDGLRPLTADDRKMCTFTALHLQRNQLMKKNVKHVK